MEKSLKKSVRTLQRLEKQYQMSPETFLEKFEAGDLQGEEHASWAEKVRAHRRLDDELKRLRKTVEKMEPAHRLAFIQCVGSRDIRYNRYCSGFCCMHAVKEAIIAKEHDPNAEVFIFGMDIRAVGKGFEEYRLRAENEAGVRFIRSRVAEVTEQADHTPVLWYEDSKKREVEALPVDLVVLSTACEPSPSNPQLAELLGIQLNEFGFFETDPLLPVETSRPGVFVCGCAQSPMDIPESVSQASSAAARAAQVILGRENLKAAS